ncbi:hypothetical protein [Pseudochelatococcus sp. G4_1912]|uniref:hypothetical protein n=1 Tax=Pseudochelatococcus sp. G4_1912 TaxID=3114288 RepID=UPI0039C72747
MNIKHQIADTVANPAAQSAQAALNSSKSVTPPFGALGMPALAAATRNAPKSTPTKASHELPHFMRNPQNS